MELNKIYNIDCIEGMKQIETNSIDMILCDLPYGVSACKWDTIISLNILWEQYIRIIKNNGAIVLTAIQPFSSALVMSNPKMFKYEWIYEKYNGTNFPSVNYQPFRVHESVLVFGNFATTYRKNGVYNYNPQFIEGKPYNIKRGKLRICDSAIREGSSACKGGWNTINEGKRYPRSVQKFLKDKLKIHPTQKPVALFEYLIKTYTTEGETVLDNCMGSGTTAIACINTNRNYIGFELDENYYNLANERIAILK